MTVSIDFGHSDENVKCVDPDEAGALLHATGASSKLATLAIQRPVAAPKSLDSRLPLVMRRFRPQEEGIAS